MVAAACSTSLPKAGGEEAQWAADARTAPGGPAAVTLLCFSPSLNNPSLLRFSSQSHLLIMSEYNVLTKRRPYRDE